MNIENSFGRRGVRVCTNEHRLCMEEELEHQVVAQLNGASKLLPIETRALIHNS